MRVIASILLALASSAHAAKPLEIFFIDVEGGQSLLIDTGWTNFSGRDADRIAAAAKLGHVKKIDYVLITHHHADHEGGVPNLLQRFKVGTFYDPGPTVDTTADSLKTNKAYEAAIANEHRE